MLRDLRLRGPESPQIFNGPQEITWAIQGCLDELHATVLMLLPIAKPKSWI